MLSFEALTSINETSKRLNGVDNTLNLKFITLKFCTFEAF